MNTPGITKFSRSYARRRATDRMVDRCKIYRPGPVTLDRATGTTTREVDRIKYEGKCRLWEVGSGGETMLGGEQVVQAQSYLSLPFNAPVPESDDIVEVTGHSDAELVGRTVKVIGVTRGGGLRASRVFSVQVIDSQRASW